MTSQNASLGQDKKTKHKPVSRTHSSFLLDCAMINFKNFPAIYEKQAYQKIIFMNLRDSCNKKVGNLIWQVRKDARVLWGWSGCCCEQAWSHQHFRA